MKKTILCSLSASLLATFSLSAQERPVELSFFHPIQLHDADTDIRGLRLNLFYAVNNDVTGLDLGLLGLGRTQGDFKGISWNFMGSIVEGDMVGWQSGLYTHTQGEFVGLKSGLLNRQGDTLTGVQYGLVNLADSRVSGVQFGVFNRANQMSGLQLGLINHTDNLHGVQIGLANINVAADPFYFFPLVNFSF